MNNAKSKFLDFCFLYSYVLWNETHHFLPQLALGCDCVRCYWRKKKTPSRWRFALSEQKKCSTEKFSKMDLALLFPNRQIWVLSISIVESLISLCEYWNSFGGNSNLFGGASNISKWNSVSFGVNSIAFRGNSISLRRKWAFK